MPAVQPTPEREGSVSESSKYEFCSHDWIGVAREFIEQRAEGADLAGISVTFNEVFTDPPAHLDPEGVGKIGWYLRIADNRIEVSHGVLAEADVRATVDYQMVLPAARRLSTDPPLDEQTQKALAAGIQREGDASVLSGLKWLSGLHDVMAVRTL